MDDGKRSYLVQYRFNNAPLHYKNRSRLRFLSEEYLREFCFPGSVFGLRFEDQGQARKEKNKEERKKETKKQTNKQTNPKKNHGDIKEYFDSKLIK